MQWIINLFASHNTHLIIAWLLGIMTALIVLRFIPDPRAAATPPTQAAPDNAPKVNLALERRFAVEIAFADYVELQITFDSVPKDFWSTVRDEEFPELCKIAPRRQKGNPSLGLWYIVEAFVTERFKYTSQVMGALCDNKAAMNELERLAERVKGFKAGQQK